MKKLLVMFILVTVLTISGNHSFAESDIYDEFYRAVTNQDLNKVKKIIEQEEFNINMIRWNRLFSHGSDHYNYDKINRDLIKLLLSKGMKPNKSYIDNEFGSHGLYKKEFRDSALSNLISRSLYELIDLVKSYGGYIREKSFTDITTEYINSLSESQIISIFHFTYPIYLSHNEIWPGVPWIWEEIVEYICLDPVKNLRILTTFYDLVVKIVDKDLIYNFLEIYIQAFLQTNFTWKIKESNSVYYEFSFEDKDIEKQGFVKLGGLDSRRCSYGYESKLSFEEAYEQQLWTVCKFSHRRGEVFSMLATANILRLLDKLSTEDERADELFNYYGKRVQEKYNRFAKKWNNNILPEYPYDKFKDIKASPPIHVDAKYLKNKYDKLPTLNYEFSEVDYKFIKGNLYISNLENYFLNELNKINIGYSEERLLNLIKKISDSSIKGDFDLWQEALKVADFNQSSREIKDSIVYKMSIVHQGPVRLSRHIGYSLFYDRFKSLISNDFYRESIKFYQANQSTINGYYYSYSDEVREEVSEEIDPFFKIKDEDLYFNLPDEISKDFEFDYVGEIGNYPITMKLKKKENKVTGYYYYNKYKKKIRIEGTMDEYGKVRLKEFRGNKSTGQFYGSFFSAEQIRGIWYSPDKDVEFEFNINQFNYKNVIKKE
ncbi:hypothetical protein [Halocella sp. SP3-1]|uniref:hypothetical protein n=1 Tax=Halocella sp. SP3-1 TaxID=2382161 RepID=UPI000F76098E|nr:hypothetical protein [Halocella sp. SP3-1]AZO94928.1 hypothetical protein D7D81_10170 [Halocella sp. SP3-1]